MAEQSLTIDELDISRPFALYANCSIEYDGRACSTLSRGNYLIIYKNDQSLLIHGGDKTTPRNYQPAGGELSKDGDKMILKRNKEVITIIIYKCLNCAILEDWSTNCTEMVRTENDLVLKIVNNINQYLSNDIVRVEREFTTDMGKIDICAIDKDGIHHIIEVKRVKATKNHCNQLRKYMDCIANSCGYIAAPCIAQGALDHIKKTGYKFIQVDFD